MSAIQIARIAFLAVAYKGNPSLEDLKYANEKMLVGGRLGCHNVISNLLLPHLLRHDFRSLVTY